MPRNRKMQGGYTARRIKALSERGRMMARARWAKDRERRAEAESEKMRELAEIEATNLPRRQGDAIGTLQWTDHRDGTVKRWTLRIGDRADRYTMHAPDGRATRSHGWTWILDHLRGFLAGRKL